MKRQSIFLWLLYLTVPSAHGISGLESAIKSAQNSQQESLRTAAAAATGYSTIKSNYLNDVLSSQKNTKLLQIKLLSFLSFPDVQEDLVAKSARDLCALLKGDKEDPEHKPSLLIKSLLQDPMEWKSSNVDKNLTCDKSFIRYATALVLPALSKAAAQLSKEGLKNLSKALEDPFQGLLKVNLFANESLDVQQKELFDKPKGAFTFFFKKMTQHLCGQELPAPIDPHMTAWAEYAKNLENALQKHAGARLTEQLLETHAPSLQGQKWLSKILEDNVDYRSAFVCAMESPRKETIVRIVSRFDKKTKSSALLEVLHAEEDALAAIEARSLQKKKLFTRLFEYCKRRKSSEESLAASDKTPEQRRISASFSINASSGADQKNRRKTVRAGDLNN